MSKFNTIIGIGAAGVAALAMAACSSAPQESIEGTGVGASSSPAASIADLPVFVSTTFGYSGAAQTLTVPSGVGYAQLSVAGASGGNAHISGLLGMNKGKGAIIGGVLKVQAGDVLTIVVGEQGGNADGYNSPGAGGWSISPYAGGRGGSGRGSQTLDGGGGGGASVVELNGTPVAIAGGGGGDGGRTTKGSSSNGGGSGGVDSGDQGVPSSFGYGGVGGSESNASNDKNGKSASGSELAGGGGGGGGGRYAGAGGDVADAGGSGGGGGGSSLKSALTGTTSTAGDDVGYLGNGSVGVTWLPSDDSTDAYAIQKTGTAGQTLEVNDGKADDGAVIDTWHNDTGPISDNQIWSYHFNADAGTGELVNKATGKCLDVNGVSGVINQWTCNDSYNQQ